MKLVLNNYASRLFHINAGWRRIYPWNYVVIYRYLSKVTSFLLSIYADSSYLHLLYSTSHISDKNKLAGALENIILCKKCVVNFSVTKTWLLSFDHHRQPCLPSSNKADANLQEKSLCTFLISRYQPTCSEMIFANQLIGGLLWKFIY